MKKITRILSISLLTVILLITGCSKKWKPLPLDEKTIRIGASPSPHAEILEFAKPLFEAKGYKLEIISFNDYIIPNISLEDGELDANFFQHTTYLNSFNQNRETHLVSVGSIHYEPFGIYAGMKSSLNEVSKGDKVLVPNDTTNEARALLLLEELGWIKLREGVGIYATKNDIVENKYNLNIVELDSAHIAKVRTDGAFAVINGNYAIAEGLKPTDALALEKQDGTAAVAYANVLCVRDGNQNHPAIKALYEVLTSKEVKEYIENTYKGAVVPLI